MKFYTYLVAWDEVHFNAVEIDEQFMAAGQPITVINSGNMKRDHWDNVGDIRYYRQFYHALKSFDTSYDYMAFLCGDVSYGEWPNAIERAKYILSTYNNTGLYAPHLTHEPWSETASKIGSVPEDEKINISIQTDGIYVFIRKDIVATLLEYFKFLEENIDLSEMKSGWGLDMIWSSIAIVSGLPILRDKRYVLSHPAGSSYDHSRATEEMNIMLSEFYSFLDSKGIDSMDYKKVHGKIYGRMSQQSGCMSVEDFYTDLPLSKKINYHIIHINDERKWNRDAIDSYLVGNKHLINSLNAKLDGAKENFLQDNKDFKISWEGFKPGEFGNFASHYLAWKYVVENNMDKLLIFEDDAKLSEEFIDKYNLFLDYCPKDYDVFSIFVHENQFPRFNSNDIINDIIAKGYQDWSTLCYIISNAGAKKLLNYVKQTGMDYPTDWFIFRNGAKGIFNVYTFRPEIAGGVEIDDRYHSQVQ